MMVRWGSVSVTLTVWPTRRRRGPCPLSCVRADAASQPKIVSLSPSSRAARNLAVRKSWVIWGSPSAPYPRDVRSSALRT